MKKPGLVPGALAIAFTAVIVIGSGPILFVVVCWLGWLRTVAILAAIVVPIVLLCSAWVLFARAAQRAAHR